MPLWWTDRRVLFNNQRGKKESEKNEKERIKITGLHIGALPRFVGSVNFNF